MGGRNGGPLSVMVRGRQLMDENTKTFSAAASKAIQTQVERNSLIARWRTAYEAANKRPAPAVNYERGFFRIDADPLSILSTRTTKHRTKEFSSMAQTLEARVARELG